MVVYLTTEPIVIALSLWVGFAWGVIFLFASSVFVAFGSYGFSVSTSSLFLLSVRARVERNIGDADEDRHVGVVRWR